MRLQLGERAFLVGTHQPAVAGHVGREDGHEPSLYSLAGQRPSVVRRGKCRTAATPTGLVAKDPLEMERRAGAVRVLERIEHVGAGHHDPNGRKVC